MRASEAGRPWPERETPAYKIRARIHRMDRQTEPPVRTSRYGCCELVRDRNGSSRLRVSPKRVHSDTRLVPKPGTKTHASALIQANAKDQNMNGRRFYRKHPDGPPGRQPGALVSDSLTELQTAGGRWLVGVPCAYGDPVSVSGAMSSRSFSVLRGAAEMAWPLRGRGRG